MAMLPIPKRVLPPVEAPVQEVKPTPKSKRTKKPPVVKPTKPVDTAFAYVVDGGKVLESPKDGQMPYDVFVGIDPGLSGGIAAVDARGKILLIEATPVTIVRKTTKTKAGKFKTATEVDYNRLAELVRRVRTLDEHVLFTLEHAHPRPGEGVVSMWAFAGSYFCWKTAAALCGIPLEQVSPVTWKRDMFGGKLKVQGLVAKGKEVRLIKEMSVKRCGELFPGKLPADFKNHNHAEALLIAEWSRRNSVRR